MENKQISLTAAEISTLWSSFLYDSMTIQVIRFMKEKVKNEDIKPAIEKAYDIALRHLFEYEKIYHMENMPVPYGFTEKDVELGAPDLFTDTFKLTYILHMSRVGMVTHTASLALAARKDMRQLYGSCLRNVEELYQLASDVALAMGLYLRRPYIPYPKQVSLIHDKSYLSGMNPMTSHRILNSIEISHLSLNIETNQTGVMLTSGFMQTAQSPEVKKYMQKGKEISKDHISKFSAILLKDDIQAPISADHAITDSTTAVFSEKLMMFHMSLMSTAGFGNYAAAAAASQRSDLTLLYEKLSLQIGLYAKDGANIMIENRWLEEPPAAPNRDQLGKNKK
ncbi:DUF3231 family protein [Bacillus salacetis]|uniref:DUF3231 family protein n=1 Tax=Bacillus salacetis TaxID=2315464 RepID=A0A3A1R106_9BACI|nr:DUF3231 family protein [Bacillus salacetis]RIW32047.1 DUF3231 family protein [Bacillus salacetis]